MQEGQERPIVKRTAKKLWWIAATLLLVIGLTSGGFVVWKANQPRFLLSASITERTKNFTPYFYFEEIPGGYTLDEKSISFDGQILLMPLTRPGSETIVLTEQPLPSNLPKDLQKNGDPVRVQKGSAFIHNTERYTTGTMIAPGPQPTLILLNAPPDSDKTELISLLQGLRAVD